MRIGFIATRLSGTDGVSLEVSKWSHVLERMGHEVLYCAGELGGYAAGGTLIPILHFNHPAIRELNQRAFNDKVKPSLNISLNNDIYANADELRHPIRNFIQANHLDLIIVENAFAIPMNLPLGVCLAGMIAELKINTVAHHHDFYWERQWYRANNIPELLDTTFPADSPSIQHITINTIAQKRLKARRGIDSTVIPNIHDFAAPPPGIDDYNHDLREAIGLKDSDIFILQPTRVIQRKGIELAIELVQRLELENSHLVITHKADDEGLSYWHWLQREAKIMGVSLQLIDDMIGDERKILAGKKIYSLWDVYPHADLVTYPSLYEGFGNALLETIYFKRPAVVNRYPVYNADIQPLGFEFIELDGFVSDKAIQQVRALLQNPKAVDKITEKNYHIALTNFSLETLKRQLQAILYRFS